MSSTVSCSSAAAKGRWGHSELGEDLCHRERMRDVGVAALAHLALVSPLRDSVGALDDGQIGLGMVLPDCGEQWLQDGVAGRSARAETGNRARTRDGALSSLRTSSLMD